MARILVGIPTKNRPELVRETIESVRQQTVADFRVLVSDNCSEPAVSDCVRRHVEALGDQRISYVLQERDGGEYGQGRFLFERCSEDYFMILHDDDLLAPDFLARAIEVLDSNPSLAIFGTRLALIDANGRSLSALTEKYDRQHGRDVRPEGRVEDLLETLMTRGSLFSLSGSVFRTTALEASGLADDDLWGLYPFDFNVFLRQAERGATAYYCRRQLVRYRWHDDSITTRDSHFFNKTALAMLIRMLERRRFTGRAERGRRRYLALAYRNYAFILYVAGDRPGCRRCLARALGLSPLAWNVWAYSAIAALTPFLILPLWQERVRLKWRGMDPDMQPESRLPQES